MSEWWTYRLSDFLLFAPRTYWRLFELYNAEIWPAQIAALALGIAIVVLLRCRAAWSGRAIATILAALWLWVAWAYHLERYATINWAATYLSAGFSLQALLLFGAGFMRDALKVRPTSNAVDRIGVAILAFALGVQPLIGPVLGRPWAQAEIFGVAPDPTVVATLGVLLFVGDRIAWELMVLPLLWCAISGATLWTMDSPDWFALPLSAALVVMLAIVKARRRRSPSPAPV